MALLKLTDSRYEEIKEIVAETFEKHDIHCVPISGFELASKMGIKIIPYSAYPLVVQEKMMAESEDGFSVMRNGQWYIFLQRFQVLWQN